MSHFDREYEKLVKRIIKEGVSNVGKKVRPRWKDGTPAYTKSIFFHTMSFGPEEVPILTTKHNSPHTANVERDWIWNKKSNVVQDLRDANGTGRSVWDEWEKEDGTIGPAYGAQLAKEFIEIDGKMMDQVDYVLHELTHNPASRRIMTELWNIDDLTNMSLTPCVHHTQWDTYDDRLNLMVKSRSADVGLGLPFNVYQYAILHRLVAIHTGLPLGMMHFVIGNAHIYDRHMDPLKEQISRRPFEAPELWINPDKKNFYDFAPDDVKLKGYAHYGRLPLEVCV